MSTKPGTSVLPLTSTIWAPRGTVTSPRLPTATIRLLVTTTSASSITSRSRMVMTRPPRSTTEPRGMSRGTSTAIRRSSALYPLGGTFFVVSALAIESARALIVESAVARARSESSRTRSESGTAASARVRLSTRPCSRRKVSACAAARRVLSALTRSAARVLSSAALARSRLKLAIVRPSAQYTVRPSALHEGNSPPTSVTLRTGTGAPCRLATEICGTGPPTIGIIMV